MGTALLIAAGVALAAAGAAGMAGWSEILAVYSYPIVWWGLLLILDAGNRRRWGASPMGAPGHFVGITLPVSVLFWLTYEFLNLRYPQWRYAGRLGGVAVRMPFAFAAYATVIPIVLELHWFLAGPARRWRLPPRIRAHLRRHRVAYVSAGIGLWLLPVLSPSFWLNQLMWFAPALLAAPFLSSPSNPGHGARSAAWFAGSAALAGISGGLLWELINFWSPIKWEYLVFPQAPHLFEMPLAGYLGFVPFAFSTLAVYGWQLKLPARPAVIAALYATTLTAIYGFVAVVRLHPH